MAGRGLITRSLAISPGSASGLCKRHPCHVVHVEHPKPIEIWRVLHGSRDMPAWLPDEVDRHETG